jgi:opacity protein-like surface antigen
MKKLTFILISLVLITSKIYSQSSIVNNQKGDQSLLFSLIGLSEFKAGSFGGGIGYQYFVAENISVRAGLGFNSFNQITYPDNSNSELVSIDSSLFSVEFSPGFKYIFSTNTTIAAFVGCELNYKYQQTTVKNSNFKKDTPEITIASSAYGGGLFLGVDWFAWENVSIGAEYKFNYLIQSGQYQATSSTYENKYDLPKTTNFGMGTSSYNFTISFYF